MNARILLARDPQPEGVDHLINQLRQYRTAAGAFSYSNLGAAALGHARRGIRGELPGAGV